MIEVTVQEDPRSGNRIITAIVTHRDLVTIELDNFDRAVLSQPEKSAADIFQSLEILARRQAEQLHKGIDNE